MNFIVVISDTLRRDFLGCYGNEWISTPNIDRFAGKCQIFDHGYSGSFPTVPHRRDVMTGRYTFTYTGWAPMTPDEPVMAELFSRADYITMMITDCPHILENGYYFDKGFDGWEWIRGQETDRWMTSPYKTCSPCNEKKIRLPVRLNRRHRRNTTRWRYEEDRFVARTMSEACRWLEDNRAQPFFLYVDTFDPHEPWDAPQWYVDMYSPGYKGEVVDYPQYSYTDFLTAGELKHSRMLYAAEVTLVDRWVGRLFQKIEDLGLFDDTMIVFTSDHGFLLGEHDIIGKSLISCGHKVMRFSYIPLYSEISRVPWIVYTPGIKPGRKDAIVQAPDIMATFADFARIERPQEMNGKSFRRVLEGKTKNHRPVAVSSPAIQDGGKGNTQPTVTDGCWAYYPVGKAGESALARTIDKAVDGFEKEKFEREYVPLLFDRKNDPREKNNVISKYPAKAEELHGQFIKMLVEWNTKEEYLAAWK